VSYTLGCIFCDIIEKKIPSDIVYENDFNIVFKDVHPKAPIHLLAVPKKHIPKVTDFTDDDMIYIVELWKAINFSVGKVGIKENGFRLIVNCGKDANQEVMHLHFHILGGKKL